MGQSGDLDRSSKVLAFRGYVNPGLPSKCFDAQHNKRSTRELEDNILIIWKFMRDGPAWIVKLQV